MKAVRMVSVLLMLLLAPIGACSATPPPAPTVTPPEVTAPTPPLPADFHPYVLKAVDALASGRKAGGYDRFKAFTRDLDYGSDCCVSASRPLRINPGPNPTMCVAAVAEVIIEALNIYAKETGDRTFMRQLPMSSWKRGNITSIRANLFMFKGTGSRGTAHTLEKFGIGQHKPFPQLRPGDFVNLNRAGGSGHSVVFLGFLGDDPATPSPTYSGNTRGFRYFSAQGQGRADGGFGYRNAYFVGKCPARRGRDDDCNLVGEVRVKADGTVVQNQILLNTGELFAPPQWQVAQALGRIETQVTRGIEEDSQLTRGNGLEEAVRAELERELLPDPDLYKDGSE